MLHAYLKNELADLDTTSAFIQPQIHKHILEQQAPLHILLIEDEDSDATLARIALDAVGFDYTLDQFSHGADVVPYLTKKSKKFSCKPTPDLILLDLGLPDRNGFEILADLSAMPAANRQTPIAILTGLKHLAYLRKCYDLPIVDYVEKPCDVAKLREILMWTRH